MKKVSITCQPSLLLDAGPEGSLQVKDVNGRGELFYVDTSGVAVQLTVAGVVNATVTGGGGSGGVTDHGLLNAASLLDDDHPQYGALAQAETVTATWSFSEALKITKVYTSGTEPAANTVQNQIHVVRDAAGSAFLRWSAQKADDSWAYVTLGIAPP